MNLRCSCFAVAFLAISPVMVFPGEKTPIPNIPAISVPAGYTVELAAGPPLVQHPLMAGFDERGRLYIAENAGVNMQRKELEEKLPNYVSRLEDTDGDGRFDKRTIFADKLTFPQGAVWHRGWLYVASSGAIWRFQDRDDDGVAEIREKIVGEFGYTGNAADVHGCFVGPDGRIYWCEGRHGHEITDSTGRVISQGKAARIFSCQPNGSDVRTHCGGGMDNPVEIDWTDAGEMLGTVNIFYQQRGDCLVHWMHGGVYPRHDQPLMLAEFQRTGEPLDAVCDYGHVAVSGCCRLRSRGLFDSAGEKQPAATFLVTEFNTHKVVRTDLFRHGSTFRAETHDFLQSGSEDFHPTDVLEDADGSLLVIDTGGWFRIGCPVSQLAKPQMLGAIYRVRRTAVKRGERPRELPLSAAVAGQLAVYYAGVAADQRAIQQLCQILTDSSAAPALQREAATSLGKIGDPRGVPAILERLRYDADRVLEHALIYALLEINDRGAVSKALADDSPRVRRAALIALDQMRAGDLRQEEVAALLDTSDVPLQSAALDVISRHPGWSDELVALARTLLAKQELAAAEQGLVSGALVAFAKDAKVQTLIAELLSNTNTPAAARLLLLDVVSRSELESLPAVWIEPLRAILASPGERTAQAAVGAILAFKTASFDPQLIALARNADRSTSLQLAALIAVAPRMPALEQNDFALLMGLLRGDAPLERLAGARAMATAKLSREQLAALLPHLEKAGPLEFASLVAAFEQSDDPAAPLALAEAIQTAPGLTSWPLAEIIRLRDRLPQERRRILDEIIQQRSMGERDQAERLATIERELPKGTATSGREVFFSRRAACVACHRVGSEGGKIGPDLSTVGQRRSGHDLLEAILYPSASLARGYESLLIQTEEGRALTGLILRETADSIHLRCADQTELRLARKNIVEMKPSATSIMPTGLETTLSRAELADLVAYLRSLK